MWSSSDKEVITGKTLVAVAIDKDKGSQYALRWAVDHLLTRGQTVVLIHVKTKHPATNSSSSSSASFSGRSLEAQGRELFLPFRCFCTRKDIQCKDIMLEDTDVAKALVDYATQSAIEIIVLGTPSKGGFLRFGRPDVPSTVLKAAPDFCTVYIISKTKISSMRSASRQAPQTSALRSQIMTSQTHSVPASPCHSLRGGDKIVPVSPAPGNEDVDFRSPFTRPGRHPHIKSYDEQFFTDTDISFVSSGRPSVDRIFPSHYDIEPARASTNRLSTSSLSDCPYDLSFRRSVDTVTASDFSTISSDDGCSISWSPPRADDVEAEMRRLKNELKQTMDLYSSACKEALTAKQKAMELQRWKLEEEKRLEEARVAEKTALTLVEKEKALSTAAIESAEASQRIAELESQKRISTEMNALKEKEERKRSAAAAETTSFSSAVMYRKYTIEEIEAATDFFSPSRKIGEGGYGPVYRAHLDHTAVAIKVLRPDAAQGRSQFQQEVEILSCIRHPNMVLLLGACPEYGCLVYEYMHNGSLEDRLFCKGGTTPLSWQHRFRVAAEIATGLLFLHQTKPEPLVHRDLKPANILLDRNLVSKISDVGLARLVPPSIADSVTQYRMTSTAGTFCYIDPEYQQTGMLGVKSDVYSLGILLLQIITAKSPMGLSHYVNRAIDKGIFKEMLDPAVPDWPFEEALNFAKLALQCAELRRKDRPDLCSVVLPELNKLRMLAEESINGSGRGFSRLEYYGHELSAQQDVVSCSSYRGGSSS